MCFVKLELRNQRPSNYNPNNQFFCQNMVINKKKFIIEKLKVLFYDYSTIKSLIIK